MGEFFGNLRAAVQATKAYPEQVDAVVWLMAQREVLPEERFYVEQHLSQVRCGSFTLFELVTWLIDGLSGLRAMFDLHQDVFLPHDSDEWLASFAWLIVMVEGDCRKMVGREHDQNWLKLNMVGVNAVAVTQTQVYVIQTIVQVLMKLCIIFLW